MEMVTGWLAPNGDMYECSRYNHLSKAETICSIFGWTCKEFNAWDDVLFSKGFAKLGISLLGNREYYVFWERKLSDIQRNYLKPYVEPNNGLKLPMNAVCEGRYRYEDELF